MIIFIHKKNTKPDCIEVQKLEMSNIGSLKITSSKKVPNGEVGSIFKKTLSRFELLLAVIILNGSNLMSEHQRPR